METGESHCVRRARRLAATRIVALTFKLLTIRRAHIVSVDLLRRSALVSGHESVQEVVTRGVVVVASRVVGEIVGLVGDRKINQRVWEQEAWAAFTIFSGTGDPCPENATERNTAKVGRSKIKERKLNNGLHRSLSTNPSIFRNKMMFVFTNHGELQIESNSVKASCMRF